MSIMAVSSGATIASDKKGVDVSSPAPEWLIATLDSTREVGYNVSIATDPETGHSYISYYEGVEGELWLARTGAPVGNCGPGNAWECQVIDSAGIVGKFSSIAVGGQGPVMSLFISYHDVTNASLKVLEGSVIRETGVLYTSRYLVDVGDAGGSVSVGKHTSVALDHSGLPHIAYQVDIGGARAIKYATAVVTGSGNCGPLDGWECTTIHFGFDIGGFIDVEVDAAGDPNIAYLNGFPEDIHPVIATPVALGGSCPNSDQWNCLSVRHTGHDTGEYLSFGTGNDGGVHLAYRNATTASLEWARYVGPWLGNCGPGDDSFQCEWIDDIGPGGSPSGIAMRLDSIGNPIMVYQDVESGFEDLKIARPLEATPWGPLANCGPLSPTFFRTWLCETLDPGDLTHAEAYGGLSLALNGNDEAAVAYRELWGTPPGEGRLKIAMEPISIFLDGFESGDTSAWTTVVP